MSEVFLRFGYDDAREADEGDEVRNSHEAVYDISQDPDDVEFDESAAGDEGDEDDAVRQDAFDADEVFDAAFTVIVPAENGRKSEQGQADAEDDAAVSRERHVESGIGQGCAIDVTHPGTADDEDQARQGANE